MSKKTQLEKYFQNILCDAVDALVLSTGRKKFEIDGYGFDKITVTVTRPEHQPKEQSE